MVAVCSLVLAVCALGVLHTYVLYPAYIIWRARTQVQGWSRRRGATAALPPVYVLMAAHNEAAVLDAKLRTLAAQDYGGPLTVRVGSDCSTDGTNNILTRWAARDARLQATLFTTRQGKPAIINQLAAAVRAETADPDRAVFVLTDASVMLQPDTVRHLVAPLTADPTLGVVDATMVQTGGGASGVGEAETAYIDREVRVKRAEGRLWRTMIGPFGGCWALRAAAFRPVPDNFLVDDFYLCMAAYEAGWGGVSSAEAVVEEAVGQHLTDEFRRKVRISSGNWQNLVRFRHLWWPFWRNPLAFAFFSHKVLRWWTPFFLLAGAAAAGGLLLATGPPYNHWPGLAFFVLLGGGAALIGADALLQPLGVHWRPARYLRYFFAMNVALLVGCWRYLTGITTNVWQPSQRN